MSSSPTYLPTHSLTVNSSPTSSDYIIAQMAGNDGDTGLINIGTFINVFLQDYIDASTGRINDSTLRITGVVK